MILTAHLCYAAPGPGWDPAGGGACPGCGHPWTAHAAAVACLMCVQLAVTAALAVSPLFTHPG